MTNINTTEHVAEIGLATISINANLFQVTPGSHTVADLKIVGHVDPAFDLLQLQDGVLVPLDDSGSVVIKGEEIFFGQPKGGGSS